MKHQPRNIQNILLLQLMRLQGKKSTEGGYSLVVTVAMLLILSTLLISAAVVSKVNTASTSASAKSNTGFFSAEAGLNIRAQEIKREFEGYNRPSGTSPTQWQDCIGASSTLPNGNDFACQALIFQSQTNLSYVMEDAANPTPIIIPPGEKFEGLSAQEYRYELNSVSLDDKNQPTALLGMNFRSRLVPLFQFAVFYNKDLEILPGPAMTLSGPVHTNGDLYLNAGNSLSILGQVTIGKDQDGSENGLYRGRKERNSGCSGIVNVYDPTNPVSAACNGSSRTQITDVSSWNDQIQLNIDYLDIPPPEALDADPSNADAAYWQKADLRVVLEVDSNGNPSDRNGNGTVIEVRQANGNRDDSATTALLRSCNVPSEQLLDDESSDGTTVYEANATELYVEDASSSFTAGDIITLVDDSAGVVIDADSNIVKSVAGNKITLQRQLMHSYQASGGPLNSSGISVRKAVVSTSDTFYNYREGKFIRMLDVDAQALIDCSHSEDLMTFANGTLVKPIDDDTEGGLVWFFAVDGPDANVDVTNGATDGNNYGVRVRNGEELASTDSSAPEIQGLTIATDQAFYVRGNYNATDKKPAAFLADSLNVLSNRWDFGRPGGDDQPASFDGRRYNNGLPTGGADSKNDRRTETTTINAAFLGGTDNTGNTEGTGGQDSGNYNGGVENYPRFHERWSGTTLNYRGSFVSLNKARRVDGAWGSQSYSPPGRNWDYDTDFNDAAKLPPLTPRFVYLRQELFKRDFDQVSSKTTNLFASMPTIPSIQPKFSL